MASMLAQGDCAQEGARNTRGLAGSRERLRGLVESAMATRVLPGLPSSYAFHPRQPLLYFIGRPEGEKSSSIYFIVLPSSTTEVPDAGAAELSWQPLLQPSASSAAATTTKLSREEELLRERMRAFGSGITSFEFHEESCRLLIPSGGKLYVVDVSNHTPEENFCVLREIPTEASGARMDAKFCPYMPTLVSFVRDGDLWVVDIESQKEKRLTFSRKRPDDDSISSGVAEFVMQEEFDRYTGYWWQPCAEYENPKLCRILYLEVDESDVELYHIPEASDIHGKTESFRYPLAGSKNAASAVAMVEFDASDFENNSPVVKSLKPSLSERHPWVEYVVRCGWTAHNPSPKPWLQLLDRKQQKLQLVSIDTSQFVVDGQEVGAVQESMLLREDTSDIWINVTDIVYWLQDGSNRFLWASEIPTGYRQLYLIDPTTNQVRDITTGKFQIEDQHLIVDEKRELIYFQANKETPLETHLYVVSYAQQAKSHQIHRLSCGGFHHGPIAVDIRGNRFVTTFSNLSTPHMARVCFINWPADMTRGLEEDPQVQQIAALAMPHQTHKPIFAAPPPELFSFDNQLGEKSYGVYWRPPNNGPQVDLYPTLLYVYGGPHVQLVVNSYSLTVQYKRYQLLASEGVACVIIDGAGSWKRGLAWEGRLRNSMGTVEIHDQILGLQYLMSTQKFIDPHRIGVTGHSYGGYLSLAFLAQRPDFFKVAIAGGPVTLWEAYDTGYTERYMDTPANNPKGYHDGSILNMITGLPDEYGYN